ncbi:MAG TPA: response regulator, partial [Candidatus Polarisedimenticolia bacterium]|nr:response regulator [Candidatus Polarisedimenticolia bacterium]
VDDEKNLRLFYRKELTEEGYQVDLAEDARAAIQSLQAKRPDLIVLDIKMPGMDGLEALSKILAKDNSIPVIFNSAFSSYRDSFMSWSANAYLIKSSDLTELKAKIRELIGGP